MICQFFSDLPVFFSFFQTLEVRDRRLLLLLVFKRVVCTDY